MRLSVVDAGGWGGPLCSLSEFPCSLIETPKNQNMVVSQNEGPQYGPQNTIVLIIGTPKMVLLILGNPHIHTFLRMSRPQLSRILLNLKPCTMARFPMYSRTSSRRCKVDALRTPLPTPYGSKYPIVIQPQNLYYSCPYQNPKSPSIGYINPQGKL